MNTTDVRKQGFLRRLKTSKRRYFVLRSLSTYGKPRLEYYESEKKFRSNGPPKRTIYLTSCFNIARKDDTKHKFVFALYTREDAFGLICETHEELDSWLEALLNEQRNSENFSENEYSQDSGGLPKSFSSSSMKREYFAPASHVSSWPVTVKPRGLGTSKNLAGPYLLQLANQTLSLVKTPSEEFVADFHLMNVRRCGHTDCFFFMEVGRSCSTGSGELWMQVDDPILAQHLHEVILLAMQSLSGESSSLSRYRCHSGGQKQRPTSLLLLSPTRARSDTDTSLHNQPSDPPSSPSKHIEENSPTNSKPSAMFQRLLSVGKRKTEDMSPRLFFRRTQSKSLSIDPCQGGLLGRAQSVDFSRLFSGADLLQPAETPESPCKEKEIPFDIDEEPVRTSSNSSGSSARSWDQSHSYMTLALHHHMEGRDAADEGYDSTRGGDSTPKDVTTPTENTPLCIITPSNDGGSEDSRPPQDDTAQEYSEKPNNDDGGVKKEEEQENSHEGFDSVTNSENGISIEADADQVEISSRNPSRYEDMSYNFENPKMKEERDDEDVSSDDSETLAHSFEHLTMPAQCSPKQRRTSEPVIISSSQSQPMAVFPVDLVTSQTKGSPKQRRTSEPVTPSKYELRELVQIKHSPSSSPRRSKKGVSSLPSTMNGSIAENPDSESDSPSSSRRRRNTNGTSSADTSDDYVMMSLKDESHTYINMTPGEGLKPSEEGPSYMNFRPGETSGLSEKNTEEHSYMNFKPGDIPEESEAKEPPSYMNFSFGSETRYESVSPRPKRKHAYENLNLNGTLKVSEFESHDYMNFSPLGKAEDKGNSKAKSISLSPRGSFGSLQSPASGRPRRIQRRESEPIPGGLLSDEETGMLFLDFSKKSSKPEKALNYVSLDLTKNKKRSGSKGLTKTRPASINTIPCQKRSWDTGPKSAPLESGYAEIDFAKSKGLRQAIQEHEKGKPQKE